MVKYNIVFVSILVLSVCYAEAQSSFDITKYGAAAGGGDATQGVTGAFKDACAAGGIIVVPKGAFLVKSVNLLGPCKGPITFNLQGTLNAPTDVAALTSGEDWIVFEKVDQLTINGGGIIDGQGQQTWAQKLSGKVGDARPTNLRLNFVKDATVTGITVQNSKMFQINVFGSTNVTLQKVTVIAPYDSPNTDGIHVGRSTGVKIIDCPIQTGDDCVSIGDGSQQVEVTGVNCGPGHGLAVGSLGKYANEEPVVGISFKGCSLTNTENGLRVKTWQNSVGAGIADDIHFEDITLTNVTYPINIDQEYCPSGNCPATSPSKVKITKLSFKGITGTSSTKQIVKLVCSKANPCQDVEIGTIDIKYSGPDKPEPFATCTNVQPTLTGTQNPPVTCS